MVLESSRQISAQGTSRSQPMLGPPCAYGVTSHVCFEHIPLPGSISTFIIVEASRVTDVVGECDGRYTVLDFGETGAAEAGENSIRMRGCLVLSLQSTREYSYR